MIVLHSAARPSLARGARPKQWVFLGHEASGLFLWRQSLGDGWTRVDLSADVAAAAEALRDSYIAWIDGLSENYGADPDWWATQIAERNPLVSPLFYRLCALTALRERARQGRLPALLVCDSRALARVAGQTLEAVGCHVETPAGTGGGVETLLDAGRLLWRSAQFTWEAARARMRRAAPRPADPRPTALLVTYAHPNSFSEDGTFCERYLTGLRESLEGSGYATFVLARPGDASMPRNTLLRRMRASSTPFIACEDYLELVDYARALWGSWRSWSLPRRAPPIGGIDAEPLLAEERRRQARSLAGMQARLTRRLPRRLAGAGFSPKLIISWFENQKDDKALAAGAREAFPHADHVGFLSMLPNPNYPTLYPTPAELRAGVLPRRLVCCGKHQAGILARNSAGLPVSIGGALRYRYLRENPPAVSDAHTALVTLPSRLWEAAELLASLAPVTREDTGIERWLVKHHPDYTLDELQLYLGSAWPQSLELFESLELLKGPLREGLAQAGVVVSAGSGAAIEAACLGIPVVIVGRLTGLDFNPLAWFADIAPIARSGDEIAARLRQAINLTERDRELLRERGKRLRGDCFEPVTEGSMSVFNPRRKDK